MNNYNAPLNELRASARLGRAADRAGYLVNAFAALTAAWVLYRFLGLVAALTLAAGCEARPYAHSPVAAVPDVPGVNCEACLHDMAGTDTCVEVCGVY